VAALQKAQLLAENAGAVRAAWRIRELQSRVADLIRELENAEKKRMAAALGLLSDDISAYYEELSPGHHITITGVTVRDSKRRQAALEATSFGKPVNPVTMFSEAEGNCLGLSLYFSQRVDRNPGWSMILLDDPVQSMDAGHEQGLVNLLARVSRQRQIIVMTHDRRFAEAVEAQFAAVPSFTRYNLYRTSETEPRLELHAGRLAELLSYAEKNAGGDQALRESCAGAVRKAVERFARELAAKNGAHLKKKMSIEEMVDRLHQHKLVDDIEVGTLHRLRRFGSRGAHDDASVNAAEPAIRASVQTLRELEARYLAPAQPQLRLIAGGDLGAAVS
jgi:ATPase subunit of ABC transporter with duplicated ATPase domains